MTIFKGVRAYGRLIRRVRGSVLGLGIVSVLLLVGRTVAQAQNPQYRLTVRPHEMATGTQTERAGKFPLDSLNQGLVYVPQSCVGTRRCPLILFFHPMGVDLIMKWMGPVADKYGMIVLAPSSEAEFDTTLKDVLRKFAIDPNKIAIVGRCSTGMVPINYGDNNPDVFNRIATFTADVGNPPMKSPNRTTEYFLSDGILDGGHNLLGAQMLRERGYPVKHVSNLRAHTHQEEDYDFLGHWLQESWATPDPSARPAPFSPPEPPVLTTEALTRMIAFWTRFAQEPDSIRTIGRRAYVREVTIYLGNSLNYGLSTLMVDMTALAAKYPSVAAALKASGLTAEQHDAYRVALVGARLVQSPGRPFRDFYAKIYTPQGSVHAMNVEFMNAHLDEFQALEALGGMWYTP